MTTNGKLSKKDVAYIAGLARLGLDEQETAALQGDLEQILDYVNTLDELDVSEVEPTYHPFMAAMKLREDRAEASPAVEEIVDNAPDGKGRYFKVPRVIG